MLLGGLQKFPHIEPWKEEKRRFGNFYKPLMRECVCTNIAKVDISLYTIETEMPAQINSFILNQCVDGLYQEQQHTKGV